MAPRGPAGWRESESGATAREHPVRLSPPLRRFWSRRSVVHLAAAAVLLGFVVGQGVWSDRLTGAWWYMPAAGLLLATGLYGSTHEIDRGAMRRDLRTVLVVVTLGVLLKAVFIAGVMILLFRKPDYLVLGIAVAQIDPLSVAAMSGGTRMSRRAKSLLSVWAAFDDPVTVLLSVYFPVIAFSLAGRHGASDPAAQGGGLASYAEGIGLNILLCAAAFTAWYAVRRWIARRPRKPSARAGRVPDRASDAGALGIVVVVILAAAAWTLMLAVAFTGLVVRTDRYREVIGKAVSGAFLLAAFGLGVLLVGGVSPVAGIALGIAAFGAQALVAWLVVPVMLPDLSRTDRGYLAFGQQNGITAIILALALEPAFPGTVGIVGPAIVMIGVLHYAANALWERHLRAQDPRSEPEVRAGPGGRDARDLPWPRTGMDAVVKQGGAH